jgi:hypothetical protein
VSGAGGAAHRQHLADVQARRTGESPESRRTQAAAEMAQASARYARSVDAPRVEQEAAAVRLGNAYRRCVRTGMSHGETSEAHKAAMDRAGWRQAP